MRCKRCNKEISGSGKPAVQPVIPFAIALAGSIYGLWYLTLSQDPAGALPHWAPATGWSVGLGSLALASLLAWIAISRRKCPACGSIEMFDAMEEEGLVASERLQAQKAAMEEARLEFEKQRPAISEQDLRAEVEAELRSSLAKEAAERLAEREKELRASIELELRARAVQKPQPQIKLLRIEPFGNAGSRPAAPTRSIRPLLRKAVSSPASSSSERPSAERMPEAMGDKVRASRPAPDPTTGDSHERARRRARVILSDLSLYYRETLVKAAHAPDAKAELGPLWRDALASYAGGVPPEIRAVSNYLEEELNKQLAKLRVA